MSEEKIHINQVPSIELGQQKPLMKLMGQMLSRRMKMPHPRTQQQSIKIKHKKVKYW